MGDFEVFLEFKRSKNIGNHYLLSENPHEAILMGLFYAVQKLDLKIKLQSCWEDGGKIGGSRVHFPSAPVKHLADLRNRANSQRYSSIYEDQRPKIEDIERSDSKKNA